MREVGREAKEIARRQLQMLPDRFVERLSMSEPLCLDAEGDYADLLVRNAELRGDLPAGTLRVSDDPLDRLQTQAASGSVAIELKIRRKCHRNAVPDQVLVGNDDMSRDFEKEPEVAGVNHLCRSVNHCDVVGPLIRCDDASLQSLGLSACAPAGSSQSRGARPARSRDRRRKSVCPLVPAVSAGCRSQPGAFHRVETRSHGPVDCHREICRTS